MVASTIYSQRLAEKPADTHGVPLGSGDWRLVVERLAGAVLGDFHATSVIGDTVVGSPSTSPPGNTRVGALQWEDITGLVRGMEWSQGSDEPGGRAVPDDVSLTLRGTARTDPLRRQGLCRPGTLLRCAVVSATDARAGGWLPQWGALVDGWRYRRVQPLESGYTPDEFAEVTLSGTLSELAALDENALRFVVGGGETITPRADRLLTAAEWRFGLETAFDAGEPTFTLQSTDMSQARLAELYRAADSTDCVVRTSRKGHCLVEDRERRATRLAEFTGDGGGDAFVELRAGPPGLPDDAGGTVWRVAADSEPLDIPNDVDGVTNLFRWARVGGTQQEVTHEISRARFGDRVSERTDLQVNTDGQVVTLATRERDRRSRTSLRVDELQVTALRRPFALLVLAAMDLGDTAAIYPRPGGTQSLTGRVRSMVHQVTPLTDSHVHWSATYAFDVIDADGILGAMLPPA